MDSYQNSMGNHMNQQNSQNHYKMHNNMNNQMHYNNNQESQSNNLTWWRNDIKSQNPNPNNQSFKMNVTSKMKGSQMQDNNNNFDAISSISTDCNKSKSSMRFVGLTRVSAQKPRKLSSENGQKNEDLQSIDKQSLNSASKNFVNKIGNDVEIQSNQSHIE